MLSILSRLLLVLQVSCLKGRRKEWWEMMIHLFSGKKIFPGSLLLSRWSELVYMAILKCKGAYDDDVDGSQF